MIRFDPRFEEESQELGLRYLDNDEGLSPGEFIEKYASMELREEVRRIDRICADNRADGCR